MNYLITLQSNPDFHEPFLTSQETEDRADSILETAGVEAGVGSAAAEEEVGHSKGVYTTYVWMQEQMVEAGCIKELCLVLCKWLCYEPERLFCAEGREELTPFPISSEN